MKGGEKMMARKEPLTISLEPSTRKVLEKLANKERRSLNNYISYMLETHPEMTRFFNSTARPSLIGGRV